MMQNVESLVIVTSDKAQPPDECLLRFMDRPSHRTDGNLPGEIVVSLFFTTRYKSTRLMFEPISVALFVSSNTIRFRFSTMCIFRSIWHSIYIISPASSSRMMNNVPSSCRSHHFFFMPVLLFFLVVKYRNVRIGAFRRLKYLKYTIMLCNKITYASLLKASILTLRNAVMDSYENGWCDFQSNFGVFMVYIFCESRW